MKSTDLIVSTLKQQADESKWQESYSFVRDCAPPTDTLMLDGRGPPGATCGLIRSPFRPSDDSCTLPFPVAANCYVVFALHHLATILKEAVGDQSRAEQAEQLATSVFNAVMQFGVIQTEGIFAYEVDGFGSLYFMDDANFPGLLGLPLIGWGSSAIFNKTRSAVLSRRNPYFFTGKVASGVGGPHDRPGWIWPMSIINQAFTSDDDQEIINCLQVLKSSALVGSYSVPGQGNGFMHESFWKDDFSKFSRPWFSWANSLFGSLIVKLSVERPHILQHLFN